MMQKKWLVNPASATAPASADAAPDAAPPAAPAPAKDALPPFTPVPANPEWNGGVRKRYARVLALVGRGAQDRRTRKSQRAVLEEAGREIRNRTDFRLLCAADLFDAWQYQTDTGYRVVHHQVETWVRIYAHWYKWRSGPDDAPVIIITAMNDSGHYAISFSHERRDPRERLWASIEKACEKLGVPDQMVAEFRAECETLAQNKLVQNTCEPPAAQGKVNSLPEDANREQE